MGKIATKKFYGTRFAGLKAHRNRIAKNIEKAYLASISKPLPPEFKSRLDGPSVAWKIFKRLHAAIDYAEHHTKDAMVFSYEDRAPDGSGQRLYLVTHPMHMWLIHKGRHDSERCSYEVIQKGKNSKLYFDMEFSKLCNPDKDGVLLTKIFIQCVIVFLKERYDVDVDISEVMWLDSSTVEKYSCHLIFQSEKTVFKENFHIGIFVSLLLKSITDQVILGVYSGNRCSSLWPTFQELEALFIVDKDGNKKIFCDAGVYTKNRNFRLYLSTKYKKNAPLLLSSENKYIPAQTNHDTVKDLIFFDSLITYFRHKKAIKPIEESDVMEDNLKCSYHSYCTSSKVYGYSYSPYPEIDQFVMDIITDGEKVGFIRRWFHCSKTGRLFYDIGNYRYCGNIGRHHKSNNIVIAVNVKNGTYCQMCHDPVCRSEGYKSEDRLLPEEILPSSYLNDDFFDSSWDALSELESNTSGNRMK